MTTAPIVYLVPSRGRPHNIAALLDAWASTSTGDADLLVAVDDDDVMVDQYLELERPEFADIYVGPRRRLGGTLNELAPIVARTYRGVGFMGDDHRPRSRGWDAMLLENLTAGAVIYGDDLIQGAALPTAVLLESSIVRTLGYFVPTGMLHLWLDNYWKELGTRLGTLRYLPSVVIEHVHPIAGRAEWDAGYAENNSDATWNADEARFRQYVATELDAAIAAIRSTI